jgi:hypothetical protein
VHNEAVVLAALLRARVNRRPKGRRYSPGGCAASRVSHRSALPRVGKGL